MQAAGVGPVERDTLPQRAEIGLPQQPAAEAGSAPVVPATGGPPASDHSSRSIAPSMTHSRVTLPCPDDSAPCFSAFVASSCRIRASPGAVFGPTVAAGPGPGCARPGAVGTGSGITGDMRRQDDAGQGGEFDALGLAEP